MNNNNLDETRTNANEEILTYSDGSCYIGQVKDGKKHGKGILSTLAFVYSAHGHSSSENAHLAKWNEYHGNWVDDHMHGPGKMLRKCFNGDTQVIYDGLWENGRPTERSKLG